jgi:hypothetical protein
MDFDCCRARYNTSGPSTPSSREMRYNPFLGSMNPKTKNMRKLREEVWKVVSMSGNGTMNLQGEPPVETIFPRMTKLLGYHVNHQGEIRKNIISKRTFHNQ